MAFAAYLVFNTDDIDRGAPLRMYLLQLLVNVLWPVFFFRLEWRLFSFFWLLLLIALVTLTMTGFKYIRPAAYYLMLPYLLWCLLPHISISHSICSTVDNPAVGPPLYPGHPRIPPTYRIQPPAVSYGRGRFS